MPEIHLDAARISQLNISDFADFTNPGGEQKAVINVNGNTFNVTVPAKDGEARVDLGGGSLSRFFSWFDGGQREAIRKQIQDRINSQVEQWRTSVQQTTSGFGDGTNKALDTIRSQPSFVTDRSVAVYGFSSIRFDDAHKEAFKAKNAVLSTIDSYNEGLWIEYKSVSLVALPKVLDTINDIAKDKEKKNDQRLKLSLISAGGLTKEKLENWAKFLMRPENLQKINIFKRLQDYIDIGDSPSEAQKKLSGWKGEFANRGTQGAMEAFVRKNVSGDMKKKFGITDAHIPILAKALTDIANKMRNPEVELDYDIIMESLKTAKGGQECDLYNLAEALDDIARVAYFRQTSKLGLDFFKENKTPVMFYWTTPQGFSMPDNNPTLTDKWWHRPDAKIDDHRPAYITFSEMRHVTKMQAAADGAPFSLSKVMGNVIPV